MTTIHLAFVRAQVAGPDARLEEDDAFLVVETGIPGLNRVNLKRAIPSGELSDRLAGLRRRFAAGRQKWMLVVQPAALCAETASNLAAAGFALVRDMPVMRRAMSPDGAVSPSGAIDSLDDLADWQALAACAYPFGGEQAQRAGGMLAAMLRRDGCRFWLHRVDGQAVACAFSFSLGGTAGLYWVATAPEWRKQGHATVLLTGALGTLAGQGIREVFLQSSDKGYSLYQSLGFVDIGRMQAWEIVEAGG